MNEQQDIQNYNLPRQQSRLKRAVFWCLPSLPAIFLLAVSGCWDYRTPGIYMDAVNPDYMVVRAINNIQNLYGWYLPGTLVFGIFPTLVQIYHGALPFYFGLPFFALFGTGLAGIRIVNTIFALLVLCSAFVLLRTSRVRPLVIALVLACLALDPSFIFSFRTQFYITVLPIGLVMIAIALNTRINWNFGLPWALCSGFASGLAIYGYFFYLFMAPAVFLHAFSRYEAKIKLTFVWFFGFCMGCSPYVLGYALILNAVGGFEQFREFVSHTLAALDVATSSMSFKATLIYTHDMLFGTILDFGPSLIMINKYPTTFLPHFKVIILAVIPFCYTLLALLDVKRHVRILTISGLLVGLAVFFMIFGKRAWLHHAMPSLTIMYVGLALTIESALSRMTQKELTRKGGTLIVCGLLGVLLATNLLDRHAMFVDLERTGGVGLASDAIVRFAEANSDQTEPTQAFFPDWGIFMSFEMITNGMTPVSTDFTPDMAIKALCAGDDVLLGVIEGKSTSQIDDWKALINWGEPAVEVYTQRDGTPVMESVRWSSHVAKHAPCPSEQGSARGAAHS